MARSFYVLLSNHGSELLSSSADFVQLPRGGLFALLREPLSSLREVSRYNNHTPRVHWRPEGSMGAT